MLVHLYGKKRSQVHVPEQARILKKMLYEGKVKSSSLAYNRRETRDKRRTSVLPLSPWIHGGDTSLCRGPCPTAACSGITSVVG